MIPEDSDLKPSELLCKSLCILDYIKEKYGPVEKKYRQVDELFDLPETKERNMGVITSYLDFCKKTEGFYNILDYAEMQVKKYEMSLRIKLALSAFSKVICQKNLDKIVDTEWTKNTGTLALYGGDVNHIRENLVNYSKRVNDLLQRLKLGINCMEEQLKKEKRTLMGYVHDLGKKKRELEYFTKHKDELRHDFFSANVKSLETSLESMYCGLVAKCCDIESIIGWLDVKLKKSKSSTKTKELEKKLILAFEMDHKYSNLGTEAEKLMNDTLFKEQASLTFEQLKNSLVQKEQSPLVFKN